MPYIVLEHSDNVKDEVDFNALFRALHQITHDTIRAPINVCKSYAKVINQYVVGEGKPEDACVRLQIYFLEGRTSEAKQALGEKILEHIKLQYPKSTEALMLQISVRLVEMKREDYFQFSS